jgi:hypothetical protein
MLIERARPMMLAEKTRAMLRHEICKGCSSELSPVPVALEPPFLPLSRVQALLRGGEPPPLAIPQDTPAPDDLVRRRVWISPEQAFDWRRSDLFLRQLLTVSYRVGFEVIGNQEEVCITILCHRQDLAVVSAALAGEFNQCALAEPSQDSMTNMAPEAWEDIVLGDYFPPPPYAHLLTQPPLLHTSPFEPLIAALTNIPAPGLGIYQALFEPVSRSHDWHSNVETIQDLEFTVKLMNGLHGIQRYAQQVPSGDLRQMASEVETKAHSDRPFFAAALRLAVVGAGPRGKQCLRAIATFLNLFQHGGRPLNCLTEVDYVPRLSREQIRAMFVLGLTYRPGFLVNSWELTGPVHIPPISITDRRPVRLEQLETLPACGTSLVAGTPIGTSNFAGKVIPVCIPPNLRGRHTHLIGRPSMGKSSLMERMILDDLAQGCGAAVLDPHGDLVERLLGLLPEAAIGRTIYFNPGDPDWVPLWNPLRPVPGQDLGRTADDLVGAFKSFVTGWGDRLEHLLRHSFYALLHLPGSSLLDVSNLFRNKSEESRQVRDEILKVVTNAVARQFWLHDFGRYGKDEFGPPKNKLSKLLVSDTVSLMLSQPDSAIHLRQIMDEGYLFLANLSTVGSEVREILGCLLLSLLHLTALSRSDMPPERRKRFYIYCDEAHRFMTDALEDLIAETRKFGVGLTLAHQYMGQFTERKAGALSSVGTTVVFNVDTKDARQMVTELRGMVEVEDLITLEVGEAIVRAGTEVVRIKTEEPPREPPPVNYRDRIIAESHHRYCRPAAEVRRAIGDHCTQWYGGGYSVAPVDASIHATTEELTYDEF